MTTETFCNVVWGKMPGISWKEHCTKESVDLLNELNIERETIAKVALSTQHLDTEYMKVLDN